MALKLMNDDESIVVTDAELVDGGDPDSSYTLRGLTREVRRDIVAKHTTVRLNPRTHRNEQVQDDEAIAWALLDYALVAWSGILWLGEPAPCELVYKMKLDEIRLRELLKRAGLNQIVAAEAARGASFRGPA